MNIANTADRRIGPKLNGIHYLQCLQSIHEKINPGWYLEIGSSVGNSLKLASGKAIAVDPNFKLSHNVYNGKTELHLFQMSSDDFFDSNRIKQIAPIIEMAFLDGMHLFEFLIRDFIGTEKACTKKGIIAMHDCIPISEIAAEREWNLSRTKAWTGDVWKVVPVLRKYRPDLNIEVLDCPPSGLTVVSNLDPDNTVLSDNYDSIINDYMDETIQSYGKNRLLEELQITSSREWSDVLSR